MTPESIDKNCTAIDKYLEKYGDRLEGMGIQTVHTLEVSTEFM